MTYSSLTSGIRAESEGQNTAMQNSKQRGLSNPLFPLTCLTAGTKSAPCVMLVFGITVTHLFVHMIVILVCTTALSVCVVSVGGRHAQLFYFPALVCLFVCLRRG